MSGALDKGKVEGGGAWGHYLLFLFCGFQLKPLELQGVSTCSNVLLLKCYALKGSVSKVFCIFFPTEQCAKEAWLYHSLLAKFMRASFNLLNSYGRIFLFLHSYACFPSPCIHTWSHTLYLCFCVTFCACVGSPMMVSLTADVSYCEQIAGISPPHCIYYPTAFPPACVQVMEHAFSCAYICSRACPNRQAA